jgi:hypothetical protein
MWLQVVLMRMPQLQAQIGCADQYRAHARDALEDVVNTRGFNTEGLGLGLDLAVDQGSEFTRHHRRCEVLGVALALLPASASSSS